MEVKWLTKLTIDELREMGKSKKHYKPFEIDGIPVFMNIDKELLPNEEFKSDPYSPFEVSNLGRIKYEGNVLLQYPHTGLSQEDDPYGYLRIWFKGAWYDKKVYQLVAETWCENPDFDLYHIVHHISNNGMDNRKENLLYVTKAQHSLIHCGPRNHKVVTQE